MSRIKKDSIVYVMDDVPDMYVGDMRKVFTCVASRVTNIINGNMLVLSIKAGCYEWVVSVPHKYVRRYRRQINMGLEKLLSNG